MTKYVPLNGDTRFAVPIIHPETGQEVSAEALYNSCCEAFGYQIAHYIGDLILDNMDYMKPPEDEDQIALMDAVYDWASRVRAQIEAAAKSCNAFAHRMLTDQGCYVHEHFEESYEDIGNGETGPILSGGPAYDVYAGDSHNLYIEHGGMVYLEPRDFRREEYEEFMSSVHPDGESQRVQ